MQVCGISEHVAHTRLICNKGFKLLEDFVIMDGDTDVLEMAKRLSSRAVVTHMNLGTVQIKRLQALFWWIHDCQTHNQPLIATEFGQVSKKVVVTGKRI